MYQIIDLHVHTTCSDGSLSPKEIIEEAIQKGVRVLSITDHDSIEAYNEELYELAKANNLKIIPGVELSTRNGKVGIHVLGYQFDLNNLELKQAIERLKNARHNYLYKVAEKLNQIGYTISLFELDQIEAVTKAHIALSVIEHKDNQELLMAQFQHIPTKGEFIEAVMNEGCQAFVEKETITPKEAALLIHSAGGKVILAHPVASIHEDGFTEETILSLVREMNADGIEAYYLYVNRNNQIMDEIKQWVDFAKKHQLLTTIGSDFHNKDGIHPEIGFIKDFIDFDSVPVDEIIASILD